MSSVKLKKPKPVGNDKAERQRTEVKKVMVRLDKEVKILKWIIYTVTIFAAVISYLVFGWKAEVLWISLLSFLMSIIVGVMVTAVLNLVWR